MNIIKGLYLDKYPNFINAYKCCNELKDLLNEYEWLKEVDSCLLRNSIFNLDNAFKRYNETIGNKPKFKSKNKSRKSYKTNNMISSYKGKTYNSIKIDLNKNIIILPKLKEIKIRGYRNLSEIKGNIKSATIYKEANKYYVSITVEDIIEIPKFIPTKIVVIDLGIKDLRIRKWECPNCLNLNERDLSASINIMFEGLKIYMKNGLELQVK